MTNDGVFEVEAILKHRRRRGLLYYFLKWKGYPESENSWESEADLTCPDLLAAYWEGQQKPDSEPPAPPPDPPSGDPPVSPTDTSPLRILAATGKRDGVLLLRVLLANGEQTVWGNDFVKSHFPSLLMRFYELHITWLSSTPNAIVG